MMQGNNQATGPIVEVDDTDDADSSLGNDMSTYSGSLTSSVMNYEWKHGRRYHSYQSGSYNFPNDEPEQNRLDMIHHVFYLTAERRLFLAPIDFDGKTILDIGTGTGIWAIEIGDQHPGASLVLGNDLSPIQTHWIPPNVKFIVDDVELDWVPTEKYDYIHCRYMAASIKDWPRLVRQCYDNLKPGGWIEFQETDNTLYSEDGTLKPDNSMSIMMKGLMEACDQIGRTMDPAPSMKGWIEDTGFTNVKQQSFKLPIGPWPREARLKEIGTLMRINFLEGVEAFTAALFRDVLGWSQEEVTALNAGVRSPDSWKNVHPLFDFLVVTAQKPE